MSRIDGYSSGDNNTREFLAITLCHLLQEEQGTNPLLRRRGREELTGVSSHSLGRRTLDSGLRVRLGIDHQFWELAKPSWREKRMIKKAEATGNKRGCMMNFYLKRTRKYTSASMA